MAESLSIISVDSDYINEKEPQSAAMISSLVCHLHKKATTIHTANTKKTVRFLKYLLIRIKAGQNKVTGFITNHSNSGFSRVGEVSTEKSDDQFGCRVYKVSAEDDDRFRFLVHRPNAQYYQNYQSLETFDHFLALEPKVRELIYHHFMDTRIQQCFCPVCAPRLLSRDATVIINIPGISVMIDDSPQCYCVPQVLSLLLANKQIYHELQPLFYNKLTALLSLKGPLQFWLPPLHATRIVRLYTVFQRFVTKWTIELPIDTVLAKGESLDADWRVKTLNREVHRFSNFLEHCAKLEHLTVVIKFTQLSPAWFSSRKKAPFAFMWLHRFLELGVDKDKAVKVRIEMHLPDMEKLWKKEYQRMWIRDWNAGLGAKGLGNHKLFFRDTESGVGFVL